MRKLAGGSDVLNSKVSNFANVYKTALNVYAYTSHISLMSRPPDAYNKAVSETPTKFDTYMYKQTLIHVVLFSKACVPEKLQK
jgi:hypothetical protein